MNQTFEIIFIGTKFELDAKQQICYEILNKIQIILLTVNIS